MLRTMSRSTTRLQDLVEDLLTVNTMGASQLVVKPAPVPVADLVGQTVQAVEEIIRNRGHRLDVNVEAGFVNVDLEHASRALRALLSNAIKFSAPGTPITVRTSESGGWVSIAVTDVGTGITDEELPRIFDRFYRTRLATDHAVQGIGLGLTIARSIVEAHGGVLTATSALGHGSTFTITLPAVPRPEAGT
nr:hypothetical protein GCM10020093_085040 [Planobispora longispora]